jgi:galactose mutarotase-like enzyme
MSSGTPLVNLTALETVTLVHDHVRVALAPSRGGMITRFEVGGTPVLFLDAESLVDTRKNVRGGNPVLFPSPGPLLGDRFSRDGRSGALKQHGFARLLPWSVIVQTDRAVTLELVSNDVTRAQYPWDFAAQLRYVLAGSTLTVETRIENRSSTTLPFALGFHPYFHVPEAEKGRARIETDATRAFDNVTKTTVDVRSPLDLAGKEVDLHLLDHTPRSATLWRGDRDRITVSGDREFRRWVVWTLAGKDFVCLEPWTSPANALNSGDGVLEVAPGAAKTLTMTIAPGAA